jgi:hypothetical protein
MTFTWFAYDADWTMLYYYPVGQTTPLTEEAHFEYKFFGGNTPTIIGSRIHDLPMGIQAYQLVHILANVKTLKEV